MYSAAQSEYVAKNLDSMERNLLSLQAGAPGSSADGLQEAMKARLEILADSLRGFAPPGDADRRVKYREMAELVAQLGNSTRLLEMSAEERADVEEAATAMQAGLDELRDGAAGDERTRAEQQLQRSVELARDALSAAPLPAGYCGSCYGAARQPTQCCNTCDEVKAAYRARRWTVTDDSRYEQCKREARARERTLAEGEGCNLFGSIEVHPTSGNLHLAPTSSAQRGADGSPLQRLDGFGHADVARFNVSHRINRLSFGDDFPGQVNPLDGAARHSHHGPGVARYFIKVVPTTYLNLAGAEVHSNQFSSTEYFKPVRAEDRFFQMPGIHFAYDITPLRVRLAEKRGRTFVSFCVRCAATIGGVFTVAGMVDKVFYSSQRLLMKKLETGKAS